MASVGLNHAHSLSCGNVEQQLCSDCAKIKRGANSSAPNSNLMGYGYWILSIFLILNTISLNTYRSVN